MPPPDAAGAAPPIAPLRLRRTGPSWGPHVGRHAERGLRGVRRQPVAVGFVVLGCLLLLRNLGLWFNDALVWPVMLAGMGVAVIWARTSDSERERFTQFASRLPGNPLAAFTGGRTTLARVIIGSLLVVSGVGAFLAATDAFVAARQVIIAVVVTIAGLALILGPWMVRLASQLREERRERIRSEERAEMAAHLHDSVLQTLALVQRRADQPREVVALARAQERELRAWLYGRAGEREADSFAAAVEAIAAEIEAMHGIDVDVVTVGDCPVAGDVLALLAATRESIVNAAKHSGADAVSVYVEVEPAKVGVSVRDRGKGFDPATVPDDRRGIADSIRARLQRHGGKATVTSAPGEGTEVELEVRR
jgi:signal transduction histidine kinase